MRRLLAIRLQAISIVFYVTVTSSAVTRLPIGGFFEHESDDTYRAFHFSVDNCNGRNSSTGIQFEKYETIVDVGNTFELNRAICCMLAKGVLALVGTASLLSQSMVESMARSFRIPYITSVSSALKSPPSASTSSYYHSSYSGTVTFNLHQQEYAIYMRPLFHRAVMDLVIIYRWSSLIYLYDNNEGLKRFQELVAMRESDSLNISMTVYHFLQPSNAYARLRRLDSEQQDQPRGAQSNNYILDFSSDKRLQTVLRQIISLGMHRTGYNYIVHSLNLNEMHIDRFPYGGGTLTGFRLVSSLRLPAEQSDTDIRGEWRRTSSSLTPGRNEELTLETALVMDSISVLLHGFRSLLRDDPLAYRQIQKRLEFYRGSEKRSSGCGHSFSNSWSHGPTILKHLKQVSFAGLTGPVSFDKDGHRQNFQLDILQAKLDHNPVKIGEWHSSGGPVVPGITAPPKKIAKRIESNKTRVVISVISRPYLMLKKRRDSDGRRFEGFCDDLAELVAEIVGFNYTIRLSRDGNYGIAKNGSWNGMIGELIAREADLAIAPLTITALRERFVDFSIPFMSLGVSIMIKRPDKLKPGVFSFLDPLSLSIWVCIVIAYLVVSFVLFLVSRMNSVEWGQVNDRSEARPSLAFVNNFTFKNSLWFALGGFMRQGCDISPRSLGGRVAGSSWWFFTLIIISSYTANLAAFLTVERMVTPIESADDLAKQTEILYGTLDSGSTKEFFQTSRVDTYKRMWSFMRLMESNGVFVNDIEAGVNKVRNSKGKYAFLLESTMNEYYNQRKPCNTIRVGQLLDYKGYGIATPIGSDLRDPISLAVLKLMEEGDLKKLQKKWWYDKGECPAESDAKGSSSSTQSALTLSNVAGIFYILIVGLSLSVVVSILQFLCISNIEARRNRKVTIAAYRRLRFHTCGPLITEEALFNNTNDRWPTNCSGGESENRLQAPATIPAFRSSVISLV